MKINVYQFSATQLLDSIHGAYKYRLEYFNATDDFTDFEVDMGLMLGVKTLVLKLDLGDYVGIIYDEEEGELEQQPIKYFINFNNRELFGMSLLGKYAVLIEFNSCWVRLYHIDNGCFDNLDYLQFGFENKEDSEIRDSILTTVCGFNIKLATDIALYKSAYDLKDQVSPIYY